LLNSILFLVNFVNAANDYKYNQLVKPT
jgi:hypothetical protein